MQETGSQRSLAPLLCALMLISVARVGAQIGSSTTILDQATATASTLLKNTLVSACDDEVLDIKCTEDYLIDVITAEYTILPAAQWRESDQVRDTRVTSLDSNQICNPPLQRTIRSPAATSTTTSETTTTTAPFMTEETTDADDATATETTTAALTTLATTTMTTTPTTTVPSATHSPSTSGNATSKFCDEQQSKAATAAANRTEFVSLVRTECHLRGSCSLDLRQPASPGGSGLALSRQNVSAPLSPKSTGIRLTQMVAGGEQCALNRRLVEVVYRCRPSRFSKRTRCRGSWLRLDCPAAKRLYVLAGHYGANANDSKLHERCLADQQQQPQLEEPVGQPRPVAATPVTLKQAARGNCSATDTQRLVEKCSFKQRCILQVDHSTFGETNCPAGQGEILSVVYTCVNETMLKSDATTNHLWADLHLFGNLSNYQAQQIGSPKQFKQEPIVAQQRRPSEAPPFSNSNVGASMLRYDTSFGASVERNVASSATTSQITTASNSNDQPQPRSAYEQTLVGSTQLEYPTREQQLDSDGPRAPSSIAGLSSSPGFVIATIEGPRATPPIRAFKGPGEQLDRDQAGMGPLVEASKMPFVAIFSLLGVAIIFASACRGFAAGSSRSSSGSLRNHLGAKDNTSSASSTGKSSNAGLKSLSSNASSATAVAHLKHNSFSESCFSLDDYNSPATTTATGPTHGSHSPAGGAHTPLGSTATDAGQAQAAARPKLWTIYSGQQPAPQHQQRGAAHQTLRPTRTFLSNQQHLAQCLAHHQAVPVAPPTCGNQAATELLLAMATSQQQQQQQQFTQQQIETNNWCNTLHQHQPQVQQQMQHSNSSMNQCAFHLQQQQCHQQQFEFPPATIQLELPQPSGPTNRPELAGLHQFDANMIPANLMQHSQQHQMQH